MTEDSNKVTLENCDYNKKKLRITSPLSLMACELIGIDQDDLIFLSKEEYIRKNQECQNLNKDLQEERYNHYNSRRRKLIEDAKKKRQELMDELNNSKNRTNYNTNNNNNKNNMIGYSTQNKNFYDSKNMKKSSSMGAFESGDTGGGTSTAIKHEREKLKKLKERQEINIRLQIDYECAMEENRRKNIEKMRLKEEKEEKKRLEKQHQLLEKMRKEEEKEKAKKKREEENKQKMEEKRKKEEEKEKMKQLEEQKKQEEEEKERKKQIQEQD